MYQAWLLPLLPGLLEANPLVSVPSEAHVNF